MQIDEVLSEYEKLKAKRELIVTEMESKKKSLVQAQAMRDRYVKARWVLTEVMKGTQGRFKDLVEGLVTKAVQAVFDRPMKFHIDFVRVRNKMECKIGIEENGVLYEDLEYQEGGGLCDIVAFAFRIVLWSLMRPKSRNVIILDEPFRFLGAYTAKAGQMLREVSKYLGLQILMITHEDDLAEIADRAWKVTHDGKMSHVRMIGEPEPVAVPVRRRRTR